MDSGVSRIPLIVYTVYMEKGINIEIKRDVHRLLKVRAAEEGLTVSETIRVMLLKKYAKVLRKL